MNPAIIFFSISSLLAVLHSSFASPVPQFGDFLKTLLVDRVQKLWENGKADFLGYDCRYNIKPAFRKFELKYDAKFDCPGLAPFSGSGKASSSSGALQRAQKEFAQKALENDLFTREELSLWLKDF